MGTVKYSGPVASFHCPTNAEIRSLKVHFSPKQEGSGDPSPENVREIVGWDGVEVRHCGKNLYDKSKLHINSEYDWNFIATGVKQKGNTGNNFPRRTFIDIAIPNATYYWTESCYEIGFLDKDENVLVYYSGWTIRPRTAPADAAYVYHTWLANTSMTVEEVDIKNDSMDLYYELSSFEPYRGETVDYEFGVLGKNKLNADAEYQAPDNTNMMPTNKRIFTPGTYCVGISWSNYYMPNNVTSYSIENGTITITNGNVYGLGYPVRVVPGQAYYLSATVTNGRAHIAYFAPDGTYISGVSSDTLNKSFIAPNDVDIAVIVFFSVSGEATFSNIQLELGSTATTYESYNPNKTVYGGWVDLVSGEVVKTWTARPISQMTVVKTNGSGVWQHRFDLRAPWITGVGYEDAGGAYQAICSIFSFGTAETNFTYRTYAGLIDVYDDTTETAEDFKTKYGNYTVAYNIRSELYEYYQLPPYSQELKTFLSHNNIWSNADYVEVEYDLHETQTILARKQFIIANQPHIVKPAVAPLQNFVTDMAAPLKSCKVYFSPVQDTSNGAPSPDNICPISGWTGLEVTRCGKNFSTAATGTEMVQKWPIISSGSSRTLELSGLEPGQEFTLSASFTKASEPSSNKRLYLVGSQKANSTSNSIFTGPSADGPVNRVIHNWVDTDGTIKITHNNRGLTYNDDFIEYAASLQNVQLELGDAVTAFEPYNGTTIPITFPSITNLLNFTTITASKTLSAAGEEISENGMSLTNYIKVNEGDMYKLTFVSKEGARTRRIYGYDANKGPVESLASASWVSVDTTGSVQATVPSGVEYIRVCYKTADENIFLEGPESSVIYGGYVDLVTGEVVQTHYSIILDGINIAANRGYIDGTRYGGGFVYMSTYGAPNGTVSYTYKHIYCDSIPVREYNVIHQQELYFPYAGALYFVVYMGEKDASTTITNVEAMNECNAWLQEHPLHVVYELETPIHYSLTAETLKTLRGTNNVYSNSNGDIELSYWTH